jgi:GNAT superfamily N-acetyltransferase
MSECDFIKHYETLEGWRSVLLMAITGTAFGRAYMYDDEPTVIYLDMLSVNESIRKKGIGTMLQEMREHIGKEWGATESWLWVKKESWMHDWYKRRGYIDDVERNEEHIWMKKIL